MAEYTIPKPYRDFYVTNPYIELKESNERLQRIVKSGYVATDSFEGAANQVITFDSPKHGFSLTNDSSKASTWSLSLANPDLWEKGNIDTETGSNIDHDGRIRTVNFIPKIKGATFTLSGTMATETSYQLYFYLYDEHFNFLSRRGGYTISTTDGITFSDDTAYFRAALLIQGQGTITKEEVFDNITSLTFSVSAYTAPSDVTVKVRTCSNLKGASLWRQGRHDGNASNQNTLITPLRINKNTTYELSYYQTTNTYGFQLVQYDSNGNLLAKDSAGWLYPGNNSPVTFTPSDNAETISFNVIRTNDYSDFTPADMDADISFLRIMPNDKMIINENDTRIVTMPPFTSLYIESNVPYHGHALDLAE